MSSGISGIISGFDTDSIIEATLETYQTQIDDMEVEILEYQVDQEAYNTVNSLLLEFSNQIDELADEDLWNSFIAASSDESSLTATLDEYAEEGTYQFEVKQLAQAAKYTSVGFSDSDTEVSPLGDGYITLESDKASLAQSTDVANLNNGEGMAPGTIKITDADGNTVSIDLSAATTIDEVISTINNNTDIYVEASISDDGNSLIIEDTSGGTGSITIADVDSTTASDLGILGTSSTGTITGSSIYSLGDSTTIAQLNDGLGVNDGTAGTIIISDGTDSWEVDLSKCTTISQIASVISEETDGAVEIGVSDNGFALTAELTSGSGSLTISNYANSDTTASDLGLVTTDAGTSVTGTNILAGLDTFLLSSISGANATGLDGLDGSYDASTVSFYAELEDGTTIEFNVSDLSDDDSLNSLITELNTQAGGSLTFSLNSVGNGISVENATGLSVEFYDQDSTLASDLGLTDTEIEDGETVDCADLDLKYISEGTSLDTLNGGSGVDSGSFILTDANGFSEEVDLDGADTIGEVISRINETSLDVTARINDTGDGIIIESTDSSATGSITAKEVDGGTAAADLGLLADSSTDESGNAILDGSFEIHIEVTDSDTLSDIMDKINDETNYTAAIINDGTEYSPYRLSINSADSGEASNFIMDSSISSLTFSQTTVGQDSLLLYGDSNSSSEAILLRSDTNTNNSAILGITLDMTAISDDPVTITVSRDTEGISDTVQAMVDAYNEVIETIQTYTTYLTEEEQEYYEDNDLTTDYGLLYGDSATRNLELQLQSYFSYISSKDSSIKCFSDLGIELELEETEDDDGNTSYATALTFDSDAFEELLDDDFESVAEFFCEESDVALESEGASIIVSGSAAEGFDESNLINGKTSSTSFGENNGYEAADTISNGDNTITITFDEDVLLDYLTIYHIDSEDMPAEDYALSDFTVEYLDSETGEWETVREVTDNTSSYTVIGLADAVSASAIRITATATNADDDIMRLVEIDCNAETGVANTIAADLDSTFDYDYGYLATRTDYVDTMIENLNDDIDSMTDLMDAKESVLWTQFNAMEETLAALETQSSYLESILGTSDE